MPRLPLIAAAAILAAGPLFAQTVAGDGPDPAPALSPRGTLILASAVQDARVYSLADAYDETFWDSGEPFGPVATAWTEIGAVEDVVLDERAQVVGVTIDIGGFLGIGEDRVLLPVEDIRLVQLPDEEGFFIVTRLTRAQLEEAEEIDNVIGD